MSIRLSISERATEDIVDCVLYVARQNQKIAEQFHKELWSTFEGISAFPEMGKTVSGYEFVRFLPLLRPFGKYLVFYRINTKTLEILRVLHASRNIPTILPKNGKK